MCAGDEPYPTAAFPELGVLAASPHRCGAVLFQPAPERVLSPSPIYGVGGSSAPVSLLWSLSLLGCRPSPLSPSNARSFGGFEVFYGGFGAQLRLPWAGKTHPLSPSPPRALRCRPFGTVLPPTAVSVGLRGSSAGGRGQNPLPLTVPRSFHPNAIGGAGFGRPLSAQN